MSEPIQLNCCVNCYWFDGFTGDCIVGVDQWDIDIYKTPCGNPIYFVAGSGHCIDNHDIWRDGDFHKERLAKHSAWIKEAIQHKIKVKGIINNYLKWYKNVEDESI